MSKTRGIRIAAIALALLFLTDSGWARGPEPPGHGHLIGYWLVEGQPDPASGVDPFVNVATINGAEPGARYGFITNVDAAGGIGVGAWKWAGGPNDIVTFSGFLGPTVRFVVRATVTASRDHFNGPFRTDVQDLATGAILFSFEGTVSATDKPSSLSSDRGVTGPVSLTGGV